MAIVRSWTARFGVAGLDNDFRTIGAENGSAKSTARGHGKADGGEGLHCLLSGLIVWVNLVGLISLLRWTIFDGWMMQQRIRESWVAWCSHLWKW